MTKNKMLSALGLAIVPFRSCSLAQLPVLTDAWTR